MSIKETIEHSILHELTVCQHLAGKIDASNADWRPAHNMRSTTELMQYLSYIGSATVAHFVNPPADQAEAQNNYKQAAQRSAELVNFNNFTEAIESEKKQIIASLKNVTDDDMLTKMTYHPFMPANQMPLFAALTNSTMKYLSAYRHQLFMYAKMCGADINTRNNWAGVDAPAAAPKVEAKEGAVA